jgi:deoxyribose-phosphate aldolase
MSEYQARAGAGEGDTQPAIGVAELAGCIDHTLLRPAATGVDIDRLCDEAKSYGFAAVCVNPVWVERAVSRLGRSKVLVASVVGFPLGASRSEIKLAETQRALDDGAREIDMVINIGRLIEGDVGYVADEIQQLTGAAHRVGAVTKVIIETALLTDDQKRIACELAVGAGADFVKTSTGFGGGGATVSDVALMRSVVGQTIGVKASGGIRTAADALNLLRAGATRLGTSAGPAIVTELSSIEDERQGNQTGPGARSL